jgi:hypothetical protein
LQSQEPTRSVAPLAAFAQADDRKSELKRPLHDVPGFIRHLFPFAFYLLPFFGRSLETI